MQVLITHGSMARSRVLHFSRWQLLGGALLLAVALMLTSGAVYHFIFLKAARDGWPVVSSLVRLVVRDEIAQRDQFMRDNLDAMAVQVGAMQAKLVQLQVLGERVSALAGVRPEELQPLKRPGGAGGAGASGGAPGGQGGPFVPLQQPSAQQLQQVVQGLDLAADQNLDVYTLVESRLMATRLQALAVPTTTPVRGPVGSGFGFRPDPLSGRAALHTGLDFPADVGTPIHAAAGGLVLDRGHHPEYGQVLEIDHGNGLSTRYAHCSKILVAPGSLVKRGQVVAEVGNSGRSTGPHLHFEVLLDGAPQDPARFLAAGDKASAAVAAATQGAGQGRRRR
jgi:murein DD-endopeptidase MepM/ murein hydrolase activator NlpD